MTDDELDLPSIPGAPGRPTKRAHAIAQIAYHRDARLVCACGAVLLIERGLTTFVEVGEALLEIRESRLYRETHATFEAYCQSRWAWSGDHAKRLMNAAEVAECQLAGFRRRTKARPASSLPCATSPKSCVTCGPG